MRRKNISDLEKMEDFLREFKAPEISDEEIEPYKKEFQRVLQSKFSEITAQRERMHSLRLRLAYGFTVFSLVVLMAFFFGKPYLIKADIARAIYNNLNIKVQLDRIELKDGVGVVIYNTKEIVVDLSKGSVSVVNPVPYKCTKEEEEKAIEIVKNSKEAKSFVLKEGEAPKDISKNPVVSVEGLMFPTSGVKLIKVQLGYIPLSNNHQNAYIPVKSIELFVDITKGKVVDFKK